MEPNILLDSTDSDRSYYDGVQVLEDYNYTKPGYQPMNIDNRFRRSETNMPSASAEIDPERDHLYHSYDKPFILIANGSLIVKHLYLIYS